MDRLQEKHDIYVKLGMLFGPLFHLIENPVEYDEQEKAETLARYFAEYPVLFQTFYDFCKSQPGHQYAIEIHNFSMALDAFKDRLIHGMLLADVVRSSFLDAKSALDAVPIPRTSVILEAGSPFTAYCRLRELCESNTSKSITWLDPFMSASLFHRFIAHLRPGVMVTLVTSEPGEKAGKKDKSRWEEFLDISRLYAQEVGSQFYSLVLQSDLHDRWVVFDEKRIFSLGGSAKDAGNKDYFTIASVEATEENMGKIAHQITTGQVVFGVDNPTHL